MKESFWRSDFSIGLLEKREGTCLHSGKWGFSSENPGAVWSPILHKFQVRKKRGKGDGTVEGEGQNSNRWVFLRVPRKALWILKGNGSGDSQQQ